MTISNSPPPAQQEKEQIQVWQPIETAPKDGTPIDVWIDEDLGRWTDVTWSASRHTCHSQYCDSCPDDVDVITWRDSFMDMPLPGSPTHWMPLPAPPEVSNV